VSVLIDIAEAVVAELNAATFSQEFTAERAYMPRFELPEMAELHVTVVPKGVAVEVQDRSRARQEVQIDVGVQKKLQTAENAEIDALMDLAEEIAEHFRAKRQVGNALWVRTEHAPVYSTEHLEQLRQFTGVVTLTFRQVG